MLPHWGGRCIYLILYLLDLAYFQLVMLSMTPFGCTVQLGDAWMMSQLPYIPCDLRDARYVVLFGAGLAGVLVYGAGIPAVLGGLLYRRRGKLTRPTTERMLGFAFQTYRPSVFWWELVFVARRVLIAVILAVVPFTNGALIVLCVLVALAVFLVVQVRVRPFVRTLENTFMTMVDTVLFFSFLGAYVFSQTAASSAGGGAWRRCTARRAASGLPTCS
jgi:hypothetical protein